MACRCCGRACTPSLTRHAGYTVFVAGMFVLPVLLTLALWRGASPLLKAYLLATLLLLAAMVPITTGLTGINRRAYRGVIQRVYTLTTFPPIGVAAWVLGRRVRMLETGRGFRAPTASTAVGGAAEPSSHQR